LLVCVDFGVIVYSRLMLKSRMWNSIVVVPRGKLSTHMQLKMPVTNGRERLALHRYPTIC
jgi:hypothetical protein